MKTKGMSRSVAIIAGEACKFDMKPKICYFEIVLQNFPQAGSRSQSIFNQIHFRPYKSLSLAMKWKKV